MKACRGVVLALVLTAPSAASALEALIQDSGFEADLGAWCSTGTAQEVKRSDLRPRTGKWGFGIGNDQGPNGADAALWQEVRLATPLAEDRPCTFAIWIVVEEKYTGRFAAEMEFLDPKGLCLKKARSTILRAVPGQWTWKKLKDRAPAGTAAIRVTCRSERMRAGRGWSFIWFDDVTLDLE